MSQPPRGLLGRIAAGAVSFTVLTYVIAIGIGLGLVTAGQFAGQLQNIRVHFFTGAFFIYPIITPISEEIAFRITILGLLVAIITTWKNRSIAPGSSKPRTLSLVVASLLSPESAKMKVGLPTITANRWQGIHWSEWILLFLTSSLFGIAHVISGGTDWGIGKAFTAAISGFALGLIYLAYGAYAAVLLHWFFDFYFETFSVGADIFGGPVATLPGLVSLATVIVGIVSILVGLAWLVRRLTGGKITTTYKPPESVSYSVQ